MKIIKEGKIPSEEEKKEDIFYHQCWHCETEFEFTEQECLIHPTGKGITVNCPFCKKTLHVTGNITVNGISRNIQDTIYLLCLHQ